MKIEFEVLAHVRNDRIALGDDAWGDVESRIVLAEGMPIESLDGIERFSHVQILFHFHQVPKHKVLRGARHPRNNRNWPKVGILAQRGKNRPNRIGLCTARVLSCEAGVLHVMGLDAVDGTPVLDIKPVMREFLPRTEIVQPTWASQLMREYW